MYSFWSQTDGASDTHSDCFLSLQGGSGTVMEIWEKPLTAYGQKTVASWLLTREIK